MCSFSGARRIGVCPRIPISQPLPPSFFLSFILLCGIFLLLGNLEFLQRSLTVDLSIAAINREKRETRDAAIGILLQTQNHDVTRHIVRAFAVALSDGYLPRTREAVVLVKN